MRKMIKRVMLCLAIVLSGWCGSVIADRNSLRESIIRMHVVANSDSMEDQSVKLKIRDAVLKEMETGFAQISDPEAAKKYLQENLTKIEMVAKDILKAGGFEETATATLCKEAFGTRKYDTFTMPAGVYEALRITIGTGEGKNWWCVVFPSLCVPTTSADFTEVAASAGFTDSLNGALTGEGEYQLRFYSLEVLGRLENILFVE